MNSSIFNKSDNDALIKRINLLNEDTKPLWGKMNASQMLSHCQAPIDVAFGDLKLKGNFIMRIIGGLFKNKILNSKHFKKNSPTVKEFIRDNDCEFEQAKSELIQKISKFAVVGHESIKNTKHPFFGDMSLQEWDKLQSMHLNHHLKQFGV
jgi:hypothetical protein